MSGRQDAGLVALETVYQRMMIDAEWSVRSNRGFTWWPKDFPQHITVTTPVRSHGLWVCRLTASTPVVDGVREDDGTLRLLNGFNTMAGTLSALVLDKGVVSFVTTATVHAETVDYVPMPFSLAASMQAADAQAKGVLLAEAVGGRPMISAHPTSGARPDYDDLLNVIDNFVRPRGQQASKWAGAEMSGALQILQRVSLLALGDENGVAAELSFGDSSSLLQINPGASHPQLGNCLHVTLTVPFSLNQMSPEMLAATLNQAEAQPDILTDLAGAWCAPPGRPVTFSAFHPNTFYQHGTATNIALSMALRAKRAAQVERGMGGRGDGAPTVRAILEGFRTS